MSAFQRRLRVNVLVNVNLVAHVIRHDFWVNTKFVHQRRMCPTNDLLINPSQPGCFQPGPHVPAWTAQIFSRSWLSFSS